MGEGVNVGVEVAEGGTGIEVGSRVGVAVGVLQPQSSTARHKQIISLRGIVLLRFTLALLVNLAVFFIIQKIA